MRSNQNSLSVINVYTHMCIHSVYFDLGFLTFQLHTHETFFQASVTTEDKIYVSGEASHADGVACIYGNHYSGFTGTLIKRLDWMHTDKETCQLHYCLNSFTISEVHIMLFISKYNSFYSIHYVGSLPLTLYSIHAIFAPPYSILVSKRFSWTFCKWVSRKIFSSLLSSRCLIYSLSFLFWSSFQALSSGMISLASGLSVHHLVLSIPLSRTLS